MLRRRSTTGFTLLELLVVMALLALMAGIAMPSAISWFESSQDRGFRHELRAVVESLPALAARQGVALAVDRNGLADMFSNPADARQRIDLAQPLRYRANGLAVGGELRVQEGRQRVQSWRVAPITGRLIDVAAADNVTHHLRQ